MRGIAWVGLALFLAACSSSGESDEPRVEVLPTRPPPEPEVTAPPDSIGVATMRPDGTIVLELRAEGGGAIGDGSIEYAPSDADYRYVLDHLGGLRPGEQKPVPPFPDERE